MRPLPPYQTDQELYDALRKREARAYDFLYKDTYPVFLNWVLRNSGTEMDAEDAFHKGMISFMNNVETGKYTLQAGTRIRSVLFEYSKCVWLSELRSARVKNRSPLPDDIDIASADDVARDLERLDVVRTVGAAIASAVERRLSAVAGVVLRRRIVIAGDRRKTGYERIVG